MEKSKKIAYWLIEIIYGILMVAFMFYIKAVYSNNAALDTIINFLYSSFVLGFGILLGPKLNRLFYFLTGGILSIYLVSQKIYYRGFNNYFRLKTALGLRKEVVGVADAAGELINGKDFLPLYILLVLTIVFVILFFVFQRKVKVKWSLRLIALIPLIIMIFVTNSKIKQIYSTKGIAEFDVYKTDYYVYDVVPTNTEFVNKFGLISFSYRDLKSLFEKQKTSFTKEDIDSFFNNQHVHQDNSFTGLFEGKNVLFVQAESLMNLAISEELTPNLFYYLNSGIVFNDYNEPILIGSTSDTEFMAITSILPVTDGNAVCYEYVNNEYPYALGNVLNNNCFKSLAFHNNYSEYYNRHTTFTNFGYEFYDSSKLGLNNLEPDSVLAEEIAYICSEKEKFNAYWITYSGHQTYDYKSTAVKEEYVNKIHDLYPNLNEENTSYLAKAMDLDEALASFVNVMDWTGRYEDFVMVIYGDHRAKGLSFKKSSNYDEVFGINEDDNPEIAYTPMIIWSPNTKHITINKPCTALDIIPTFLNLWNIKADNYYLGHDIMDENYNGLCFDANGNINTKDFKYNSFDDSLNLFNSAYTQERAQQEINNFSKLKEMADSILKLNYFQNN